MQTDSSEPWAAIYADNLSTEMDKRAFDLSIGLFMDKMSLTEIGVDNEIVIARTADMK
jgi:hypothetical protein